MKTPAKVLLQQAHQEGYAIGAFNVYNLEGVLAVVGAAQAERSPAILQLHAAPLRQSGAPLISLCLTAAQEASVPVAVHLDHATAATEIRWALSSGIASIMADGSFLSFAENTAFTTEMGAMAHACGACVEAELGRLSGMEDGLAVAEREAKMTDPEQAQEFVSATGVDALAVCIGNVHGNYVQEPRLDFDRLASIRDRVALPLVLHGASGLPENAVRSAIELGVAKFNVNTEMRSAYIDALRREFKSEAPPDLLPLMQSAVEAMQKVVVEKLRLFGSAGKATVHITNH